jgi:hypothetical protein
LTVIDAFDTPAAVPLLMSWHLGPGVLVDLQGTTAALVWKAGAERRRATLELPEGLTWTAHMGETDPIRGWYSPRFGRRVPATSLAGRGAGSSATKLVTVLTLP